VDKNWKTKLIRADARVPEGFRPLSVPVRRASTAILPNAAFVNDHRDRYETDYPTGAGAIYPVCVTTGQVKKLKLA
jgi:hypothetical protein